LASHGHATSYAVPDGTDAVRADLRGANLREADLREADLREAYLREANLSGANLREADLSGADLRWANLRWANLSGAFLSGADLRWANLRGANLSGASLSGADLIGAAGIASIGPVGRQRRTVYAVAHDDGPKVQAGCWWGSVEDTIARIEVDYADDHSARDLYVAAVRAVVALVTP
jgi:uncharacterized protein YjbI with pentapeptide repeats